MSKLSGTEDLTYKGNAISKVNQFWEWSYSDLKEPTNRGNFAEYIIYLALKNNISQVHYETRMNWDVVDFVYGEGISNQPTAGYFCNSTGYGWGIEVKSASSSNRGGVHFRAPKRNGYFFKTNTPVKIKRRWADIYIFALFKDDHQYTKDILDIDNWAFYIVPAYSLKTVSVGVDTLGSMRVTPVSYQNLKPAIDGLIKSKYVELKSWKDQHDKIKKEYIENITAK